MSKTVPKGVPLEGLTEAEVLAEIERTRKALEAIDDTNDAEKGEEWIAAHKAWRDAEEALTRVDRDAPQGVGE